MSDADIISAIKRGEVLRDKALQQLYHNDKLKRTVFGYITTHGGNVHDAKDVFQDTLVLFDRQIRENNFKGQSSLVTYFVGIAKWRWVSNRRKFGGNLELKSEHFDKVLESVEARAIENERRDIIDEILTKIGDRCKTILKLYKLSYSMEEIADEFV